MRLMLTAGAAFLCLVTACTSAVPAAPASAGKSGTGRSATAPAAGSAAATAVPPPSPRPKRKPPSPGVSIAHVHTGGGVLVTVATFRGPVRFVLHNGGSDPGWAASSKGVTAGSAVGHTERSRLLAAFNGGFKLSAGAGGYEQEGHLISPLLKGFASLIIDRSGRARIAVWGYGAPAADEAVYSVRQNLQPLVSRGRPTRAAGAWYQWGATLGGGEYVARSAVGEDAAGHLMYAGSMSASPEDLAVALARRGARIAMELDINPEWVQLDVASRPGGTLRTALPGQNRPADQFVSGWSRDFFTVLGG